MESSWRIGAKHLKVRTTTFFICSSLRPLWTSLVMQTHTEKWGVCIQSRKQMSTAHIQSKRMNWKQMSVCCGFSSWVSITLFLCQMSNIFWTEFKGQNWVLWGQFINLKKPQKTNCVSERLLFRFQFFSTDLVWVSLAIDSNYSKFNPWAQQCIKTCHGWPKVFIQLFHFMAR